jgi:hypothetical protein
MMMPVSLPLPTRCAALGVGNNMIDGSAKLGGLLFDVGPSFSDGLFHGFAGHLVGLVVLSVFVLLDHLGSTDFALLLGTIYAVIASHEPRIAQTFVLVVVEALVLWLSPSCQNHPWLG